MSVNDVLKFFVKFKPIEEFIETFKDHNGKEITDNEGQIIIYVTINVPPHAVGILAGWPLDLDDGSDIVGWEVDTSYKRGDAWFRINFKEGTHTLRFVPRDTHKYDDMFCHCSDINIYDIKECVELIIAEDPSDLDKADFTRRLSD